MKNKVVIGKNVLLAVIPIEECEKPLFSPSMLATNPPNLNLILHGAPIMEADVSLEDVERLLQGKE